MSLLADHELHNVDRYGDNRDSKASQSHLRWIRTELTMEMFSPISSLPPAPSVPLHPFTKADVVQRRNAHQEAGARSVCGASVDGPLQTPRRRPQRTAHPTSAAPHGGSGSRGFCPWPRWVSPCPGSRSVGLCPHTFVSFVISRSRASVQQQPAFSQRNVSVCPPSGPARPHM